MERDTAIFYRSFYDALNNYRGNNSTRKKIRLQFYDALFDFAFSGKEPEGLDSAAAALFALVKPQIIANNRKFLDGNKGGRPKNQKPLVLKNDEKNKPNEAGEMKKGERSNEKEIIKEKNKYSFGKYENVFLSVEEYQSLKAQLGDKFSEMLERFSDGLQTHGYKYSSHYQAILKWAQADDEHHAAKKPGRASERAPTYDINDFEKIMNSIGEEERQDLEWLT